LTLSNSAVLGGHCRPGVEVSLHKISTRAVPCPLLTLPVSRGMLTLARDLKAAAVRARTPGRQGWVRLAYYAVVVAVARCYWQLGRRVLLRVQQPWETSSDEEEPMEEPMTFNAAAASPRPTRRRNSSASCSAPPAFSGGPATSKTHSVLPAHPPPKEVHCQCREAPRAIRLQVADTSKGTWGRFFYKCAQAKCKTFIWEEMPEERAHWP